MESNSLCEIITEELSTPTLNSARRQELGDSFHEKSRKEETGQTSQQITEDEGKEAKKESTKKKDGKNARIRENIQKIKSKMMDLNEMIDLYRAVKQGNDGSSQ